MRRAAPESAGQKRLSRRVNETDFRQCLILEFDRPRNSRNLEVLNSRGIDFMKIKNFAKSLSAIAAGAALLAMDVAAQDASTATTAPQLPPAAAQIVQL